VSTFFSNLRQGVRASCRALLPVLAALAVLITASGGVLAGEQAESLERRIDRLIEELGHDKYTVRERAQQELAELGYDAYEALLAAAEHDDLEIATRAEYLLRIIAAQWSIENEPPLVRHHLAYYRSSSPERRVDALNDLARLSQGAGTAALCRLVRFEKSTEWSKQAAIALINGEPVDAPGRARWAKTVREQLGRSARPGAEWLRTYLASRDDPKKAASQWTRWIRDEQDVLQRASGQGNPSIIAALMYYLALDQAEQGNETSADETAGQALRFGSNPSSMRLRARIDMALALAQRGRFQWADSEHRLVLGAGSPRLQLLAGILFSESLHDRGENLAAAQALERVLQLDPQALNQALDNMNRTAPEIRGRMAFFLSCHWEEQGDRAKQRRYLEEAVQHDKGELDALIARYRLPEKDPDFHQQTRDLVDRSASFYRRLIAETPDNIPGKARFYNQFAWLVGNTEGDLDEALECAHKAVELRPDAGAYLDTLAHVHFARGELQSAVKSQTKAAQLEPHSGLIKKKLQLFRDALSEKETR
jgi:Flp pilus assembly protein TadD